MIKVRDPQIDKSAKALCNEMAKFDRKLIKYLSLKTIKRLARVSKILAANADDGIFAKIEESISGIKRRKRRRASIV